MKSWGEVRWRHVSYGMAALVITGCLPPTASAEEVNANVLEEIVVTAQRRTETLQTVPIAVTALRSEEIRKADIHTLNEISMRTPGFSMGSFNKGQPQLYIRGIGSNADGAGTDPSVVVFSDGVYIGRGSGAVSDLYDLERVEVLRGPQGTLFGKNAIGGAISLHTTKPDETFHGRAEISAGNLDAHGLKALISGPITDRVFGKLSGSYRKRDGYVDTILTDETMSDQDTYGLRGALRFVPSDTVEIQVNADYSASDESAFGRILLGDPDPSTPDILWAAAHAHDPKAAEDHYTTFADQPGAQETDIRGISARLDWEVAAGTLTSITAFRASEFLLRDGLPWDLDVADVTDGVQTIDEEADQFSQELRFAGHGLDERLEFIAGLYYLREEAQRDESTRLFVRATEHLPVGLAASAQDNTTDSASAFVDVTYDLTESVSLAVGARYTYEEKEIHQVGVAPQVVTHTIEEDYDVTAKEDWDAFTPRIALRYQASDAVFLYGSVSRGFKSGGFAGAAPTAIAAMTPFDPEHATAYEIGAKTELLNRRLRLNTALFTTDYEDLQVAVRKAAFPGDPLGVLVTDNAADATSEGFEVEFEALLFEGLTVSGSYAYLNAEYDNYLEPNGIDNAGNPLRNAPENVYDIVASYSRWLSNGAEAALRFEYFHSDRAFQEPRAVVAAAMPEYELANLRLSYTTPSGDWELAVWSKNLFDEEYLLHNVGLQPLGNSGVAGPPRTYGVTVTSRFGEHD